MNHQAILLLLCLVVICATNNQAQNSNKPTPTNPIIILERFPDAFGVMPDYKVSIYSNEAVIYEGRENVKAKGTINSKITLEELQQLITEFEKIGYFSLKDRYGASADGFRKPTEFCPEIWMDQITVYTSITLNEKRKQIAHYHGCRGTEVVEKLTKLENRIDAVVNTKRWVYK